MCNRLGYQQLTFGVSSAVFRDIRHKAGLTNLALSPRQKLHDALLELTGKSRLLQDL